MQGTGPAVKRSGDSNFLRIRGPNTEPKTLAAVLFHLMSAEKSVAFIKPTFMKEMHFNIRGTHISH